PKKLACIYHPPPPPPISLISNNLTNKKNSTNTLTKSLCKYSLPFFAASLLFVSSFFIVANAQAEINTWSDFVTAYKSAGQGATITLTNDLTGVSGAAIGAPNANNIIINGSNKALAADEINGLGFLLSAKTLNFKDISFYKFLSNSANGAVVNLINNSKAVFSGSITFVSNKTNETHGSGGALYAINSNLSFTASTVNFINNSAIEAGGSIGGVNTTISFDNSSANFISNKTSDAEDYGGGALYTSGASNISFTNSNAAFINNEAANNGGAIHTNDGSTNISFKNSNVIFSGNSAGFLGGAIFAYSNSNISFTNSTAAFTNNKSSAGGSPFLGAAIFLGEGSKLTFTNSTLKFQDNFVDTTIRNDIYLMDAQSAVTFSGANIISNGILISGDGGIVKKTGSGSLFVQGDKNNPTIIQNNFSVEGGAVEFQNAVSTISILTIQNATLSLSNGVVASTLYVTGNLNLTGTLKIDIDFSEGIADWISVGGKFNINNNSNLAINVVESGNKEVKILTAAQEITTADLQKLKIDTINFFTEVNHTDDGWNLLVGRAGIVDTWSKFVVAYKKGGTIIMDDNITADENSSPLGQTNANNITIDGSNKTLDANKIEKLGFAFNTKTITFKDITFSNFASVQYSFHNDSTVMSLANSNVTFTGNINFIDNNSTRESYYPVALEIYENSIVSFINSTITFINNDGVIDVQGRSTLYFTNSSVTFINNVNGTYNYNASIYFSNSFVTFINSDMASDGENDRGTIYFVNSTAAFINNGRIYSAKISITNSVIEFSSAIADSGGAIYSYMMETYGEFPSNSNIVFTNSKVKFSSNTAVKLESYLDSGEGGAIAARGIGENVNISINNSKVEFSSNTAYSNGGAIFGIGTRISFSASTIVFFHNTALDSGGAIYLTGNSNITFANSLITFKENFSQNQTPNDVYLDGAGSALIFSGNNTLTNGIHTSGTGVVRKTGSGSLFVEGDKDNPTIINNNFSVEGGAVEFQNAVSTIAILTVKN
ncbi:MAG: hypothetical protein LBC07_05705, partial [Elusimicrobiota bacterium]|nr:hypothetical protein [Elusimicrobiota bacterium]